MWTWISWAIVVAIVIIMCVPWKWNTKAYNDTQHPAACIDCNRAHCRGCALEHLTAEQADEIATQLTQQAIADNSIVYSQRFQKEDKHG
jgi:tRNA U34 2-thiouridine synthase MnmA/TrmU